MTARKNAGTTQLIGRHNMFDLQVLEIICIFLLCGLSCFGYGRVVIRSQQFEQESIPFFTMGVGLALICFVGGVLNSIQAITSARLWIILITGFVLALWHILVKVRAQSRRQSWPRVRYSDIGHILLALIVLLVLVKGLSISNYFNHHDDFLKYFSRPVRMLAIGTLSGDPFNAQGLDALGGQDFFHGFVLLFGGVGSFNSFDAIFCLVLCLLVLRDAALICACPGWSGIIAAVILLAVPPQQVNISALYSGTLFILVLVLALIRVMAGLDRDVPFRALTILPAALCLAAGLSLKNTLVPFLILDTAIVALFFLIKRRRQIASVFVLLTMICLAPWLVVNRQLFWAMGTSSEVNGRLFGGSWSSAGHNFLQLFSRETLFYGASALAYSCCLIILLLLFINICVLRKVSNLSLALGSGGIILAVLFLTSPFMLPFDLAIRYVIPVLCSLLPLAMIWLSVQLSWKRKADRILVYFVLGSMVLALQSFVPEFIRRIERTLELKTTLAYSFQHWPITQVNYLRLVPERSERAIALQAMVPERKTVLYWGLAPHALDFSRNTVFTIGDGSGLTAPWLGLSLTMDAPQLKVRLSEHEIDYVIWEYKGQGIRAIRDYQRLSRSPYVVRRTIGHYGFFMFYRLREIALHARILFDDGHCIVFQLNHEGVSFLANADTIE